MAELEPIAREAGRLALDARSRLDCRRKPDGSIVTNGDVLVEEFLRPKLQSLIPGSEVWGEELGRSEEGPGGLWLIDPIDGTTNFAAGSPLWGVSLALIRQGRLLMGAIYLPELDEMCLGCEGGGVTLNGITLLPIPPGSIDPQDPVSVGDWLIRDQADHRLPGKIRCSGAFVIDGVFTATQRYRGMIGYRERLYDAAASILFGQELGADVRYADGEPLNLRALSQGGSFERPWLIFPAESAFRL